MAGGKFGSHVKMHEFRRFWGGWLALAALIGAVSRVLAGGKCGSHVKMHEFRRFWEGLVGSGWLWLGAGWLGLALAGGRFDRDLLLTELRQGPAEHF